MCRYCRCTKALIMKIVTAFCIGCLTAYNAFAQTQIFDLVTYKEPANWEKTAKENVVTYSTVDKDNKAWCQVSVIRSTASKGSIEADLASEWDQLAATQYNITDSMEASATEEAGGWKIKAASGKFVFNEQPAAVLLTTFSGYGRCVSIVATTNNEKYIQSIQDFVGAIDLIKPADNTVAVTPVEPVAGNPYAFSTTNFDDGWSSVIKSDWVEVTKENIKVLIHYPKEGTIVAADPEPATNAAWNILVAPRYSNLKNYKAASPSMDFERAYTGSGYLTDNATGKEVYVVLFRKGNSGWLEFITPDKKSFVDVFGVDIDAVRWDAESSIWTPLRNMSYYNRFAIAASDFSGRWEDRFSSNTFYTNVYTGLSAGMSTYSSSQFFEFGKGQTYKWELVVANSYGGSTKFANAKGAGKFTIVNNWQIEFSDIEGRPKKYDAYFSCVKGDRILFLNDAAYPGSGIFTGFARKKE